MDPQTQALRRACAALWLSTLSLMTAFMQTQAPAHRYLLARRIAGNLEMLRAQDCFSGPTRASFASLSGRWGGKAARLAPRHDRAQDKLGIAIRSIHG